MRELLSAILPICVSMCTFLSASRIQLREMNLHYGPLTTVFLALRAAIDREVTMATVITPTTNDKADGLPRLPARPCLSPGTGARTNRERRSCSAYADENSAPTSAIME